MIYPTQQTSVQPLEILLVEDKAEDAELVRNSLLEDKTPTNLHHVIHGEEAMRFLRKKGDFAGVPDIHLILLDLEMPVMDGRETMDLIAEDPDLRHLPVVVLSALSDDDVVYHLYRKRCSSFIQKPTDFENFCQAIHGLTRYWASVAKIPRTK